MPYRNPNQLLGTEGGSIDDRGGHPYVFVETTTANPTTASIKFEVRFSDSFRRGTRRWR